MADPRVMNSFKELLDLLGAESPIQTPYKIPQNSLLHATDKTLELTEILLLKRVADYGKAKGVGEAGISRVSEETIRDVHDLYGPKGLFQLNLLATAHEANESDYFMRSIEDGMIFEKMLAEVTPRKLECDNARLPESSLLTQISSNVVHPSLSRKLFRVGRHQGALVHGLGGARILVSHPFQGRQEDMYDIYPNTIDVLSSLNLRGYRGVFHFFDYLPGLNFEVNGMPAWAIWFSIIAAHADLVIFVKEYEGDFGPWQELEIELTPDRIQKKIVLVPHEELKWAKKSELAPGLPRMYVGKEGTMTEEEWFRMEAEHALPFVQSYTNSKIPKDRLFVIDEEGKVATYPLDHPVYSTV